MSFELDRFQEKTLNTEFTCKTSNMKYEGYIPIIVIFYLHMSPYFSNFASKFNRQKN